MSQLFRDASFSRTFVESKPPYDFVRFGLAECDYKWARRQAVQVLGRAPDLEGLGILVEALRLLALGAEGEWMVVSLGRRGGEGGPYLGHHSSRRSSFWRVAHLRL